MRLCTLIFLFLLGCNQPSRPSLAEAVLAKGPEFYAAPAGRPSNSGTKDAPFDLATALKGTLVKAGATLWLRGGVYSGKFTSKLTGTERQAILVRQLPGERAVIDGSLEVKGPWTTYWGFEVTNSNPDRITKGRPVGVNILGAHTKFINLVVHDAGGGMGFWTPAEDSEIYGCIIYHNGWQGSDPDRGHGHGIYVQNDTGIKTIADNILFNQFGFGLHAYTEKGAIDGLDFEGNVAFNNGSATRQKDYSGNILVGGRRPAARITLRQNYTYHPPAANSANVRLYYNAKNNKDVICEDNYFAGGNPVLALQEWERVTLTQNTLWGFGALVALALPHETVPQAYRWERNTYISDFSLFLPGVLESTYRRDAKKLARSLQRLTAPSFRFQGAGFDFAGWQKTTGFDQHGRAKAFTRSSEAAAETAIFVRPNRYESGRAHIIVYNWGRADMVNVNVGNLLRPGIRYEVHNVLDYWGAPVASGIYTGKSVSLPMTGSDTSPEFNAFVLTSEPH